MWVNAEDLRRLADKVEAYAAQAAERQVRDFVQLDGQTPEQFEQVRSRVDLCRSRVEAGHGGDGGGDPARRLARSSDERTSARERTTIVGLISLMSAAVKAAIDAGAARPDAFARARSSSSRARYSTAAGVRSMVAASTRARPIARTSPMAWRPPSAWARRENTDRTASRRSAAAASSGCSPT